MTKGINLPPKQVRLSPKYGGGRRKQKNQRLLRKMRLVFLCKLYTIFRKETFSLGVLDFCRFISLHLK